MKIRYYGHVGQLTGYGRAAADLCHALVLAGADLEIRSLAPFESLKLEERDLPLASLLRQDHALDPRPEVVIVHTLPMDCPRVVQIATPTVAPSTAHQRRPVWVAYTTWEALGEAPKHVVQPFEVFDEVWHPSQSSAETFDTALAHDHRGTVRIVPHCFNEGMLPYYRERLHTDVMTDDRLPIGPVYRFYSIGAFTARKNPIALIRAFAHAFTKADDVELLLACQGMTPTHLTHAICATGFRPQDLPPVRSEFQMLTDLELWMLHRGADCFVSSTRGEAWNLPAFEAVLAGRHVIAPRGHGHDDFLKWTSAVLYGAYPMPAMVEVRVVQDGQGSQIQTVGAQGLTSKSLWREPDVLQLAEAMRAAYDHRIQTLETSYDLTERFGYRAVGMLAMTALSALSQRAKDSP